MKNEVGLYIHVPFCIRKCNYCAFPSFSGVSNRIKVGYVDKLVQEISFRVRNLSDREVKWVYIGGGTPSTLSLDGLREIIQAIPPGYEELSVELNPGVIGDCSREASDYLVGLKILGINRLSIGVQSFNDQELKLLGRIHNSVQAKEFLQEVKSAGFKNFNIDLMIGLPNQDIDTVLSNIETAASFSPTHISAYLLSIDPGTNFEKLYRENRLEILSEQELEEQYFSSVKKLESLGYKQYEISNFARNGFACKYNLNTWRNGEYIGCGLAAGNFISGYRYNNTLSLDEYLSGTSHDEDLEELDEISNFEFRILLGLRLREGVKIFPDLDYLPRRYEQKFKNNLDKLISRGLLEMRGESLRIPQFKILLSDRIITDLLV